MLLDFTDGRQIIPILQNTITIQDIICLILNLCDVIISKQIAEALLDESLDFSTFCSQMDNSVGREGR